MTDIASHIARIAPTVHAVRRAVTFDIRVPYELGHIDAHCVSEYDDRGTLMADTLRLLVVAVHPTSGEVVAWSIPEFPRLRSINAYVDRHIRANWPAIRLAIDAQLSDPIADMRERPADPVPCDRDGDGFAPTDDGTNHESLDADWRDGGDA